MQTYSSLKKVTFPARRFRDERPAKVDPAVQLSALAQQALANGWPVEEVVKTMGVLIGKPAVPLPSSVPGPASSALPEAFAKALAAKDREEQ